MTSLDINKILNIFDENNLSCFYLNRDSATITISDDLDDELLYNEIDTLTEQLETNGIKFIPEDNYFYLDI